MIYVIVYQDGMDGIVHSAHTSEKKARDLAIKLNGNGIRYGTFEVHKTTLDQR